MSSQQPGNHLSSEDVLDGMSIDSCDSLVTAYLPSEDVLEGMSIDS